MQANFALQRTAGSAARSDFRIMCFLCLRPGTHLPAVAELVRRFLAPVRTDNLQSLHNLRIQPPDT